MHKSSIGFSKNEEFLPDFFDEFNSKERLRQLFLDLSSSLVKDYYSFSKYEQKNLVKYSLENIFKYKINSLKIFSHIKIFKKQNMYFKFCLHSTLIINNYFHKQNKINIFASSKLLPLAKIISTCFINNKLEIFFDKNLLFHEFVLNRVKKLHKNKTVLDNGDSICVIKNDAAPLKIYTSWKDINVKDLNIKNELSTAINSIKQSEFKQIYLVYPKMKDFSRHIKIKVEELENTTYEIKVIPYSLRSIIRKNKGQ